MVDKFEIKKKIFAEKVDLSSYYDALLTISVFEYRLFCDLKNILLTKTETYCIQTAKEKLRRNELEETFSMLNILPTEINFMIIDYTIEKEKFNDFMYDSIVNPESRSQDDEKTR